MNYEQQKNKIHNVFNNTQEVIFDIDNLQKQEILTNEKINFNDISFIKNIAYLDTGWQDFEKKYDGGRWENDYFYYPLSVNINNFPGRLIPFIKYADFYSALQIDEDYIDINSYGCIFINPDMKKEIKDQEFPITIFRYMSLWFPFSSVNNKARFIIKLANPQNYV